MSTKLLSRLQKLCSFLHKTALVAIAYSLSGLSLAAQTQGPLHPVPPVSSKGDPVPAPAAKRAPVVEAPITTEPPALPPDQLIGRFSAKEAELQKTLGAYTWSQSFQLQTLDPDDQPDGNYKVDSDILFTPDGKRFEKVTYAPANTLQRIVLTQQDLDDLKKIQPFSFTGQELEKYKVTYVGRQKVDDLSTYIFDVAPKTIEKNQRYFQGRLWVDDHDLQIVKTYGKAVPDIIKKNTQNLFPHFTTYRENLFGDLWFPTYTHIDDTLHFREGPVHLVVTVKYTNYKRFGSTTKIGVATPIPEQ